MNDDPDMVLLTLMQVEEQLAYEYARCSVLHRVKAHQIREAIYEGQKEENIQEF